MPKKEYTKIKAIGSGSFGRAFLVQSDQRYYVIKEIDLSGRDSHLKKSAEVEVKVLSCLKHPYIVRYHESFMADSVLNIVMDYCDGGDLWHHIDSARRRRAPIPEGQIVRWFTQMCLGLKYMHEKKPPILHRDIKTQNIFLARKEGSDVKVAKIADFGISKVLKDDNAMAVTMVGTPYYLSPEICQKQPYGSPSDIWALGCVLFEMCALRVPFDAKDMNELVRHVVRGPMPRIPPNFSRELQELVSEAMTREAAKRPSASALLQRKKLQDEIKVMLQENRVAEGRDGEQVGAHVTENGLLEGQRGGEMKRVDSARGEMTPRAPLADRNARQPNSARGPSPTPRGPGCATPRASCATPRGPSPQRGAAHEVLRPSRAPTPRGPSPQPQQPRGITPRGAPGITPRGGMPRPSCAR